MKLSSKSSWQPLSLALLVLVGASTFAVAELVGPLGVVMHSMMTDQKCLQNPAKDPATCSASKPADFADDLLKQAQSLEAHPEWVTAIVPGATVADVQAVSHELVQEVIELQSAIAKGDDVAIKASLAKIQATKKAAHEKFSSG